MIKHFNEVSEHTKNILDGASIATVLGTLANILPAMAAIWTIVWTTIRIYETKTVQSCLKKKNAEQE